MGSGTLLTKDMRNRRRYENQRKHDSLVDTIRGAPENSFPAVHCCSAKHAHSSPVPLQLQLWRPALHTGVD